jgi:hypothetical protein
MIYKILILISLIVFGCTTKHKDLPNKVPKKVKSKFHNKKIIQEISSEIVVFELDAPKKSFLGDSKITIIRLNKDSIETYLKMASTEDSVPKTAKEWSQKYGFHLTINAGMYDVNNPMLSRGYMKSESAINNFNINPNYNGVCVMNNHKLDLIDFICQNKVDLNNQECCFQSMRMLDCQGVGIDWQRKKQLCSMIMMGEDEQNHIYIIFTRSPYLHQDMVGFLKKLPFDLRLTLYLEGGPETSLYLNTPNKKLELVGSYVSETYETDSNKVFWPLPNVIGFKFKGK